MGDVDQLPSVGAGDVFRQLIQCGLIPVTVLDLVYRQGATSSIPVNAKLMQEGKTNLILGDDFVFVPCKGTEETADTVKRLYQEEVIRNGLDQVQILTPFRIRTAAGVVELNRTLEDIINPPVSGKKELVIGKDVFRVGDKIIQNKNTALISNGDMGTILDFDEDEEGNPKISIQFTENRRIEYELEQMEMIEHANAITVHKSQGSECPVVIIPWVKAFYVMLKRNILYTAVTRAKSKVYLVGDVLYFLASTPGRVYTKKQIYKAVWKDEYVYDDDNIMAVISKIRKKIEDYPAAPKMIQTIRGVGYRFSEDG